MNTNFENTIHKTIHNIVIGVKTPDGLARQMKAGEAYLYAGANYYVFRLSMFPGVRYFLKRNNNSMLSYTVYAKRFRNDGLTEFDEPVGAAYLNPELKTHLEIKFPILGRSAYMSLFPSEEM